MSARLTRCLASLKKRNKAAFIPFLTSGYPSQPVFFKILCSLPKAGADIIEVGLPFSDPMADGPVIQMSSQKSLAAGNTLAKTFASLAAFRKKDTHTPLVLMGYYNTIYYHGVENFFARAKKAGADAVIIVDLPFEEEGEVLFKAHKHDMVVVRLIAPTTQGARLKRLVKDARGFIYYVSIAGTTGTKAPDIKNLTKAVGLIKKEVSLPVAVGFGIKTARQAKAVAAVADGVVVGSALVEKIAAQKNLSWRGVVLFAEKLAQAVHAVRK